MSDESPSTADGGEQPTEQPLAPPPITAATDGAPPVTPAPVAAGSNNRLGLIIGAVVVVVALIIGVVVATGGGDDDGPTSDGTQPVSTDGPTTSDNGGASNHGGDPNDPCSSVSLSTDLTTDNLDAVTGTCDGTWAVAARDGDALFVANFSDGTWRPMVDVRNTVLCRDDALGFQWPAAVIDAVQWPCTTFETPQLGAYVAETPDGEPLEAGMKGERVAALQHTLAMRGLLAPEDVDGMFGGGTRQAVLTLQAFGGLQMSAQADLATLRSLDLLPAERVSQSNLVTNGAALGNTLIGGNGRVAVEYLSGILGAPDRISLPTTREADASCHDPDAKYYTWSGLTVEIAGFDPVTFADTDVKVVYWRYEQTSATLDIATPSGARVGQTTDEWRSRYSKIDIQDLGDTLGMVTVDQGLIGRFDDAGTVVLIYSGQRNCQVAP